jgi:hypothetical protein
MYIDSTSKRAPEMKSRQEIENPSDVEKQGEFDRPSDGSVVADLTISFVGGVKIESHKSDDGKITVFASASDRPKRLESSFASDG